MTEIPKILSNGRINGNFTYLLWFRLMVEAPEMLEPWIRERNGRCIEMFI